MDGRAAMGRKPREGRLFVYFTRGGWRDDDFDLVRDAGVKVEGNLFKRASNRRKVAWTMRASHTPGKGNAG